MTVIAAKKKKKRKPPRTKTSTDEQHARFVKAARDIGADETGAEFERTFRKLVPPKTGRKAAT